MHNLFFNFCNDTGIGFGSDPHFGLLVDETLTNGSTHTCRTYDNDVLSDQSHFTIVRLEVWGFKGKYDL